MKGKKLISMFLAMAMLISMLGVTGFASEDESENWIDMADTTWYVVGESEFTISTAEELAGLAKLVGEGTDFNGIIITLGASIDLEGKDWTPIGDESEELSFNGAFDGNNNIISNLTFNIADDNGYYGMFGYLSGSVIEDIDFVGANVSGGFRVAVLCGYADSTTTIDGITVDGTSIVSNIRHAAGICGESYGVIKNCLNEATISSDSEWGSAAGIAAWLEGTAENCKNTGTITGNQKNGVAGGIAGYAADATITNSSNSGIVSVSGGATHAYAGGIAAYTENEVIIADCINTGEVNADDDMSNTTAFKRCAGGVVGYHNTGIVSVSRSINNGDVTGYNYAGGIIGHILSTGSCDVKYCYNNGTITSNFSKREAPSYASGIVGYTSNNNWAQQVVEYCVNSGVIENNAETDGETLQVAYSPVDSYYFIGATAYDAATNAPYVGTLESLASLLNTGLEPESEFWGVVDGGFMPLGEVSVKNITKGRYYTTIDKAITDLADGDTITILSDELILDKKILFKKNNITIQGQTDAEGKPISTIKGAGNSVEQFRIEGYNVTVRDLIFDNIAGGLAGGGNIRENVGVYFYYPNNVWQADRVNKLINCVSNNTYFAIFSGKKMSFEMKDCTFTKTGTESSVFMDRPYDVTIEDCSFSGQDGYALHIDNGVVDGRVDVINSDFTGGVVTAGASENNTGTGHETYTFTDCNFYTSSGENGGWYASYYSSRSRFYNCTFDADFDGAGTGRYSYQGSYVYLDSDCTQDGDPLDTTFFYSVGENVISGVNVILNDDEEIIGGIYTSNVTAKTASGYYAAKKAEGVYEIVKSPATVVDTARSSGVQITLNNLEKNSEIDPSEDATYQLVVKSLSVEDREAVTGTVDTSKTVIAFDFSVQKVVDGNSEEVTVTNQKVTITLPTPVTDTSQVKIYHIENGVLLDTIESEDITFSNGNKTISFIAPSFSTYAVEYDAPALADTEITRNIEVVLEQVPGIANEYDLVLKATDADTYINGLLSADLTFDLDSETPLTYEISGAANINVWNKGDDRFEFNYDGIGASSATGEAINIGKIIFEGYCNNATFTVFDVDTNIVHTTKAADSIVDKYDVDGDGTTTGKLGLGTGIPNLTIETVKKNLAIVIDFPNAIADQIADYQDMAVTITGSGITPIVVDLGTDGAAALAGGKYTVNINDTLVKDYTYTVTVSGAGYRTARYNVTMTGDKVLNFWNNVKDTVFNVEEGNSASAKKVTFLAGDIVKDNNINLYDLSAVVSYFGMINLNSDTSTYKYAKYDLNRDGKIDSKDVAYVLVSWDN